MSLAMSTALSALMVTQRMSEVASNNIANVNTPGYSRQVGVLKPSLPVQTTDGIMGTGVTVDNILAIRDSFLNMRIGSQKTNLGMAEAQNKVLAELEGIILPSPDAGLGNALDQFFEAVNELVNSPQSEVSRESILQSASTLSTTFRTVSTQLRQLQLHVKGEFDQTTDQVNSYVQEIADLNGRIMASSFGANAANDLVDERNLLIEKLSQIVPIQTVEEGNVSNVLFEGKLVVGGTDFLQFASDATEGRLKLRVAGTNDVFETASGSLGGQAEEYNQTIPRYIEYVDEMAHELIGQFNRLHSTGVGLQNGYTTLTTATELADLDGNGIAGDEPLAAQPLAFPPSAGTLYITVTNETTGEMQRRAIDYDPAIDSISTIAEKIASVPCMNASVTAGFLTITSWAGYRFDFSNKLLPDGGALGGSTVSVSGAYRGTTDRAYTFYPINSGTVGQTNDLRVAVVDNEGRSLGLLQVGADYAPGTPLQVADGVSVSFGAGQLQATRLQTASGPFALADGDELTLAVNGGAPAAITLQAADFADITQATASELAAAINAAGIGVKAGVVGGALEIFPERFSPAGSITVGGSAAPKLGLAPGTVANDSQTIQALGNTDTGGLLAALTINPFFEGEGAGSITLAAHVRGNLANIAAAKTSPPGDNANAVLLTGLKTKMVMANKTQTLNDYFASVVGKVGIEASQANRSVETQTKLVENLERQRDSVVGVSLEEEMAKLMQNQQAYLAAIRLLKTVDEMLQSLTAL